MYVTFYSVQHDCKTINTLSGAQFFMAIYSGENCRSPSLKISYMAIYSYHSREISVISGAYEAIALSNVDNNSRYTSET